MERELKFKAYCEVDSAEGTNIDEWVYFNKCPCDNGLWFNPGGHIHHINEYHSPILQYTGVKDKNGKEIYFGDKLRFADKWEWYRGSYGIKLMFASGEEKKKIQAEYEAEPYEERIIEGIEDYEWILSDEIQTYWVIIGNIHTK